jgi:hypothetical protein
LFVERHSGQVSSWYVAFETEAKPPTRFLIPGTFKHVRAFGYCAEAMTWVFVDPQYAAMDVFVVPKHEASPAIDAFVAKAAVVLKLDARRRRRPNARLIGCCTSTVRDILGLPGYGLLSSLPDRLYRDCIRAGAARCVDNRPPSSQKSILGIVRTIWAVVVEAVKRSRQRLTRLSGSNR